MPNFPASYVYNGEPVDTVYWRYSIRGHVKREQDKAYYWPKLAEIYAAIAPLIAGWEDCRLNSDQALQRMIGKPGSDGSFRGTLRNAPVGGLQKLTLERLEKVGSKYLSDNDHLIAQFENDGKDNARFYEPKGRERVYFFLHEMFGFRKRLSYDRSIMYQSLPHDLWLRIGGYTHQYAMSLSDPVNQALDLYIWQNVLGEQEADALALKIGALTSAIHIWKAESGFRGESYVDEAGLNTIRYAVYEQIEDAKMGHNLYGSRWIDLLDTSL